MKLALLLLPVFFISTPIAAQSKTYLAESWANVEQYHDLPTAIRNTIYEKVSVVLSQKSIKAIFGDIVREYTINSKKPINEMSTSYTTTRNNKTCIIIIIDWNNVYSIACYNEWSIYNVTGAYLTK